MEFVVPKKHLSRALDLCRSAIDSTASHPAARSILFEAEQNLLKAYSTSLDLNVSTTVECETKAPGAVALEADRFRSMVRQMPEGQLRIKVDAKHKAVLTASGSELRYQVSGQSAKNFPKEPVVPAGAKAFLIPARVLRESIVRVQPGVGDQGRPERWGVTMETSPDHLNAVAIHGHKMFLLEHKRKFEHSVGGFFFLPEPSFKPLLALAQDDEVTLRFIETPERVFCLAGQTIVSASLPAGHPPNWKEALRSYRTDATVCRADVDILLQAVRAVAVAAPSARKEGRLPPIELHVSDKSLRIDFVNTDDAIDASNVVAVDASSEMRIKLEPTYLIEALESAGNGITELRYDDAGVHSPLIIVKDDRKDDTREIFSAFIALRD